jgi:membrane-bound lytic murein transglycosylase B
MQFEPSTFAAFGVVGPGGSDPPSPYDPVDAVYSAARLLCADGGGNPSTVAQAVYAYNHSSDYVARVVSLASAYGAASGAPRP